MLKASQKPPGDKLAPEAKKKGFKAGPNSIKSSPIPFPLVDAEKAIKLKGKKAGMSGQEGDGADLNIRGGKQAGSLLQTLAQAPAGKNVASRVRRTTTSSDGAGVASLDRIVSAEGISGNPAGSGGERVGPSILAGLKAGKLSQPPSKQISAPKTGPWRKIAMPTPLHVDWKAPLEYALNSSGTSSSGWSGFDDAEKPIAVIVPEDQLDPTTDLVGVEVYNDGLAPDSDEIELESKYKEQILKAKKESKTRKWSTPTLSFESRFECGNLRKAIRKGETEYTLFMRDDVCSMDQGKEVPHCAQWFYFQVVHAVASIPYTISIVNFVKPESLYQEGMRPLLYSRIDEKKSGKGWFRVGEKIEYFANNRKFKKKDVEQNYHSLRFTMVFPHDNDECYLAMCYPYTYTDMQRHLRELSSDHQRSKLFTRNEFCRTMAGNAVELLLIGSEKSNKPAIILSGRVHPGESNASLMMHGMIDYILGPSSYASELRKNFTFYVVPMLNPDGVILGNYRCNLSGHDLNRSYTEPDPTLHPEICAIKKLARELASRKNLALFLDMHGHSSKKGFFLYCCDETVASFPNNILRRSAFYSMESTTFKIGKYKATTGRAIMYNEPINCVDSYTCEASFLGADFPGSPQSVHFTQQHLRCIGAQIIEALAEYLLPGQFNSMGFHDEED